MKVLPPLKAAVLLLAAVTVVLRFLCYKYAELLEPSALRLMQTVSLVSAAGLLLCGAAWAILEKKQNRSAPGDDAGENGKGIDRS